MGEPNYLGAAAWLLAGLVGVFIGFRKLGFPTIENYGWLALCIIILGPVGIAVGIALNASVND